MSVRDWLDVDVVELGETRLTVVQTVKGKSVQAAADEVRYASASALSRAFAANTGLSPTAWRRQGTTQPRQRNGKERTTAAQRVEEELKELTDKSL